MGLFTKKQTIVIARPAPMSDPGAGEHRTLSDDAPSIPTGMWEKCVKCASIVYAEDLQTTLKVCPRCSHHFRLSARQRLSLMADDDTLEVFNQSLRGGDPLGFPGYEDKLRSARTFTGLDEAIITAMCKIGGHDAVVCAMDSNFMMASMGYAVGEKFTLAAERALEKRCPLVVFTASGGARMQEGMVSLMQMAKTSGAIGEMNAAGLLYLVVLTDPTTGGVTASFAMLGDITLAEPGALIGFAGRRVIEQTTRTSLPAGFQSAEFLLEKGFIDAIVPRAKMRGEIAKLLAFHKGVK